MAVGAGAGEGSRWWAAVFGALAPLFVPAAVYSVRPHPRRNAILRATTVLSLVLAVAGSIIFGPGVGFLLAPPTALLAVGAGLILQGGR